MQIDGSLFLFLLCFLRFVYESLNWQPNRAFIIFNYARRDAASIPISIPIPTLDSFKSLSYRVQSSLFFCAIQIENEIEFELGIAMAMADAI